MNAARKGRSMRPQIWMLLPLLQVLLLAALARNIRGLEWLILTTFLVITGFSSWQLFADQRPYSINKIWWLFGVAFLGVAPSVQTALHHSPWREGDIRPATMLYANGLILLSLLLYYGVRQRLGRKKTVSPAGIVVTPPIYVDRFKVVAPVLLFVCGAAMLFVYGWKGLFLRGYYEAASLRYNPTFQLIFDKGIRGVVLYLSLACIYLYRRGKVSTLFCLLVLAGSFLLNFPLAISRNLAFTIYISWLLTAGFSWLKRQYTFITIILSLLLLAAPLADVTRYAGTDMGQRLANPAALFKKAYLVTDYDAYSSLCRTLQFVHSAGSTRGRQAAGVLLFFVPRKVWPQKPIGSGAYLFTRLDFEFKNVSCTYLAEGYINFGLAGTLLFVLILAIIIVKYDQWYWRRPNAFRYAQFFYPVFIGMMLFILRGDLLSSYAYTCGLFLSGWLLHRLLSAGIKTK